MDQVVVFSYMLSIIASVLLDLGRLKLQTQKTSCAGAAIGWKSHFANFVITCRGRMFIFCKMYITR